MPDTQLHHISQLSFNLEQAQQLAQLNYWQGRFQSQNAVSQDWLASLGIKEETKAAALLNHSTGDRTRFHYRQAQAYAKTITAKTLTAEGIQQLHQQLHPKGGQWRQLTLSQPLRHQPQHRHQIKSSLQATDEKIDQLITQFQQILSNNVDPLIAIPLFVFELLLIFPFLNGNRRVALLLAKQLLIEQGHSVLTYQSLEIQIIGRDPQFYQQLYLCSQQQEPIQMWLSYWWRHLQQCYQNFEQALATNNIQTKRGGKTQLIKETIQQLPQPFSLKELQQHLPTIGPDLIRKVVRDCRGEHWLASTGRGRSAKWQIIESE